MTVRSGQYFLYREVKIITKAGLAYEGTVNNITSDFFEVESDIAIAFIPRDNIDAVLIIKEDSEEKE